MKADGNVTINGGNISVTTTGNGAEGIESKAVLTVSDGTLVVNSYDDGLNSSSHMYIKGGDITVVASGNDGIDSNGNLYISGGVIRAFGTSAPECGIDANEEDGYSVIFTGGTLLAVGGGNSVPSTAASTQTLRDGQYVGHCQLHRHAEKRFYGACHVHRAEQLHVVWPGRRRLRWQGLWWTWRAGRTWRRIHERQFGARVLCRSCFGQQLYAHQRLLFVDGDCPTER